MARIKFDILGDQGTIDYGVKEEFPKEIGRNKSLFPLVIDDLDGTVEGHTFKMDKTKRDEFLIVKITDLEYYKGKVIICKRVDSNEPINLDYFKRDNKLFLMVAFVSPDFGEDFADWKIDIPPSKNSLQEIFDYTNNLNKEK